MQSQIETRAKELMAKDGLSPLQAWNQAYREVEDALDQPTDIRVKKILQELQG